MEVSNYVVDISSKEIFDVRDLTDKVQSFIGESRIKNGLVNIQIKHTTATVLLNENEPLLLEDIKENLNKLFPQNINYRHDDFNVRTVNVCKDEFVNGHSHCKAIGLPSNITLNLVNGSLDLGKWQRILFMELDRARERKISIQILGN